MLRIPTIRKLAEGLFSKNPVPQRYMRTYGEPAKGRVQANPHRLVRYRFSQHPDGAPYAQHSQPSGPGRSGPTAACAEHRKQRIRAHHGESRRLRRARALEEFRGGVLSNVDTGDPLSRQPFLNGDACANG